MPYMEGGGTEGVAPLRLLVSRKVREHRRAWLLVSHDIWDTEEHYLEFLDHHYDLEHVEHFKSIDLYLFSTDALAQ